MKMFAIRWADVAAEARRGEVEVTSRDWPNGALKGAQSDI